MKILIDEQELGAIVIAWAKEKYKTENIGVVYDIRNGVVGAVVEVTMHPADLASKNMAEKTTPQLTNSPHFSLTDDLPNLSGPELSSDNQLLV